MKTIDLNLLIICASLFFQSSYDYYLNNKVVYDLNSILKVPTRKKLQLFIIFIVIIYIFCFFTNQNYLNDLYFTINIDKLNISEYQIKYLLLLPLVFLIISYPISNSNSITEYGIRLKKVKNEIITWGQIYNFEFIDNKINHETLLIITYSERDTTKFIKEDIILNLDNRYIVENFLNSMRDHFNKKDNIPLKYYPILRKVVFVGIFITFIFF